MAIHISVLTPEAKIFDGPIVSVKVPGVEGEFQVLKNHAPLVSALGKGLVTIVTATGAHKVLNFETGELVDADEPGKTIRFRIVKGFIEVLNNEIALLVEGATKEQAAA